MTVSAAFRGFIETSYDALLIFEGCRSGVLPKIDRRLQEFEKKALVVSGAVFVFDEEETGIKRWTDGLTWSPSRTLGNFLIYRELDKGERKGNLGASGDSAFADSDPHAESSTSGMDRALERALVGSLTSAYRFRRDGLVKKTMAMAGMHMIAYYRIDDVTSGRLRTPSSLPELNGLRIPPDLLDPALFRVPPKIEIGFDGLPRYAGEGSTETSDAPSLASSTADVTRLPQPSFSNSQRHSASPATVSSSTFAYSAPAPSASSLGRRPSSSASSGRATGAGVQRPVPRFEPYGGRPLSSSQSASHDYASPVSWPTPPLTSSSSDAHPFGSWHSPNLQGSAADLSQHRLTRPTGGATDFGSKASYDPPRTSESAQFSFQRPRTALSDASHIDSHGSPLSFDHQGSFAYTTSASDGPQQPVKGAIDYWAYPPPSTGGGHSRYGSGDRHLPQLSPRPTSSSSVSSLARPMTGTWPGLDSSHGRRPSLTYEPTWPLAGGARLLDPAGSGSTYHVPPLSSTSLGTDGRSDFAYATPSMGGGSFSSYRRPNGLVIASPVPERPTSASFEPPAPHAAGSAAAPTTAFGSQLAYHSHQYPQHQTHPPEQPHEQSLPSVRSPPQGLPTTHRRGPSGDRGQYHP